MKVSRRDILRATAAGAVAVGTSAIPMSIFAASNRTEGRDEHPDDR